MKNRFVVEIVDRCTGMGCDSHYGHHPYCGVLGVGPADQMLSPSSMWDFSNGVFELEVIRPW